MRPLRYRIHLSEEERTNLQAMVSKGATSARAIRRAQVPLAADESRPGGSLKEYEIAERAGVHVNTVFAIQKPMPSKAKR